MMSCKYAYAKKYTRLHRLHMTIIIDMTCVIPKSPYNRCVISCFVIFRML